MMTHYSGAENVQFLEADRFNININISDG